MHTEDANQLQTYIRVLRSKNDQGKLTRILKKQTALSMLQYKFSHFLESTFFHSS